MQSRLGRWRLVLQGDDGPLGWCQGLASVDSPERKASAAHAPMADS